MSEYYLLVYLSSLTTHRCEMCTAPAAHENLAQLTLGSKPLTKLSLTKPSTETADETGLETAVDGYR